MPASRPVIRPGANILITRADRIGDLVLSTPVFEAVKKHFPSSRLACLTLIENRAVVEGNPYLDEVILYDKKGSEKGAAGNIRFSRSLAGRRFDAVIHLHATNRMHLTSWLAGIPVRIGWKRRAPFFLTHAFEDVKREGGRHESVMNFDLLAPLGIEPPENPAPFFPSDPRADRSLDELIRHRGIPGNRPWLILAPSASCPSKRWPAEKFGEAARRFRDEDDAAVIVIGAAGDEGLGARALRALGGEGWNLCGSLSLAMLAGLFRRARLLITNDSGPAHIAAACGLGVAAVFGRSDPGLSPDRWRPLGLRSRFIRREVGCEVCLAHRCRIGFLCLDAVTVGDVVAAAEPLWQEAAVISREAS